MRLELMILALVRINGNKLIRFILSFALLILCCPPNFSSILAHVVDQFWCVHNSTNLAMELEKEGQFVLVDRQIIRP